MRNLRIYPYKKEDDMFKSVLSCRVNDALKLLEEIFLWMHENLESIESIQLKVFEIIIVLYRRSGEEFAIEHDKEQSNYGILRTMKTEIEIKNYVKNVIIKTIDEIGNKEVSKTQGLVIKICDFIEKNYMKPITLEEASEMVGLSRYYFSKVFKRFANVGFADYVTGIRLKKSKELLKDPTIYIKDVGFFVGYEDSNYFSKIFKDKYGLTPTEYRKKTLKS